MIIFCIFYFLEFLSLCNNASLITISGKKYLSIYFYQEHFDDYDTTYIRLWIRQDSFGNFLSLNAMYASIGSHYLVK